MTDRQNSMQRSAKSILWVISGLTVFPKSKKRRHPLNFCYGRDMECELIPEEKAAELIPQRNRLSEQIAYVH
jgi:hypothetical protein